MVSYLETLAFSQDFAVPRFRDTLGLEWGSTAFTFSHIPYHHTCNIYRHTDTGGAVHIAVLPHSNAWIWIGNVWDSGSVLLEARAN